MPQSILIVDDEKDILEFLSYNLKNEGYKVFQSRSGEEAIKITNEINPEQWVRRNDSNLRLVWK